MRINRTVMVALTLLVIVGLAILSACPQKAPAPDENGVAARPKPVQPAKTPQAPPIEKATPAGPATASFDGFDSLVFGMAKAEALTSLPFDLGKDEGMVVPNFALNGDEAYLFKVPYSKYPLLQPNEEAKSENFGIAVGFWEGRFEYFSFIISPKHLERAGWERVIAKFNADYGPPADTSTEKDGTTTISWMDAKGRAVSLVESPMTDPDALYKITYQSDTWLALFTK